MKGRPVLMHKNGWNVMSDATHFFPLTGK